MNSFYWKLMELMFCSGSAVKSQTKPKQVEHWQFTASGYQEISPRALDFTSNQSKLGK